MGQRPKTGACDRNVLSLPTPTPLKKNLLAALPGMWDLSSTARRPVSGRTDSTTGPPGKPLQPLNCPPLRHLLPPTASLSPHLPDLLQDCVDSVGPSVSDVLRIQKYRVRIP